MQVFMYLGKAVQIKEDIIKGKPVFWIYINSHPLTFVSRLDTAKRIATGFIDVVTDAQYSSSRKVFNPYQNNQRIANNN